jgi:PTH1 family peptidyl-tRNA hydrolase
VGLGNPGNEYQQTRHNAGFLVVDRIAAACGGQLSRTGFRSRYGKLAHAGQDLLLVQPQTYMNLSGEAVGAITAYYKIGPSHTLVIYDDLDLPLGALRFRSGGSAGGHRGLTSVLQVLKTQAIPRIRIGIGRPAGEIPVPDYVLGKFNGPDQAVFDEALARGAAAALSFIANGPEYTMNHFNSSQPQK